MARKRARRPRSGTPPRPARRATSRALPFDPELRASSRSSAPGLQATSPRWMRGAEMGRDISPPGSCL